MKENMEDKYFTYVLISQKNSRFYIGQTNNIEKRLQQHNFGKVNSTKPYIPYKLVYLEKFLTKNEAVRREKELKATNGRRFLRKILKISN